MEGEELVTECTHTIETRKLTRVLIDIKGVVFACQLAAKKITHPERGPASVILLEDIWNRLCNFQQYLIANTTDCDVVVNTHNQNAFVGTKEVLRKSEKEFPLLPEGSNNGDKRD